MSWLNSKILTVPLLILSVWMLFSVISVEIEKDQTKKEEKSVEAKISGVKKDNELLEKQIENFKNPEFLEKEARIRLNYKAAGEEVVFVYKDSIVPKASSSKETSPAKYPVYEKIQRWLLEVVR